MAQRVDPGAEDQWRTEDCQVECVIARGSRWFRGLDVSGITWITSELDSGVWGHPEYLR